MSPLALQPRTFQGLEEDKHNGIQTVSLLGRVWGSSSLYYLTCLRFPSPRDRDQRGILGTVDLTTPRSTSHWRVTLYYPEFARGSALLTSHEFYKPYWNIRKLEEFRF